MWMDTAQRQMPDTEDTQHGLLVQETPRTGDSRDRKWIRVPGLGRGQMTVFGAGLLLE